MTTEMKLRILLMITAVILSVSPMAGQTDNRVKEIPDSLPDKVSELPELTVESKKHRVLHILAYVREYSTLSSYSDTVFLFREKMVDFMLKADRKVRFTEWSNPRTLTSRSYYKFTNNRGLDSVSDESRHHFSWSDWLGIPSDVTLPAKLKGSMSGSDTIQGKYSPAEIWTKNDDRVIVEINVLANPEREKWVSDLSGFFKNNLDFYRFIIRYDYDNVVGDSIVPRDLTGYSFEIESNGRGHDMFRFSRYDVPFFVTTSAQVYILDKEYITVKEAKKWVNTKFDTDEIGIFQPMDAPELPVSIRELIARINSIDKGTVRLGLEPDERLKSDKLGRRNFRMDRRALLMLKQMTGISAIRSRRKLNNNWKDFRKKQSGKNFGNHDNE